MAALETPQHLARFHLAAAVTARREQTTAAAAVQAVAVVEHLAVETQAAVQVTLALIAQ
jgi:hypothetical protein